MKKCLVCNVQNRDEAVLCEGCGAPLPEITVAGEPVRRKSKAPLIIGIVLALAAIGVGVWFFTCRGGTDSKSLVRGMPKGVAFVGGINVAPILEIPIVKEQLAKEEAKQGIEMAKSFSGVDVLATKGVSFGVQVKDGSVHLLAVVKGSFNVDHLRNMLRNVGKPKDVKGTPMVLFALSEMLPKRLPKAAFRGLPEAEAEPTEEPAAGEGDEAKAEIVEPKEPEYTELPTVADVVLGPVDESTFLVGSEALVTAYLAGGDTLADDAELAPLLDKVSANAIYWGLGRMKKDSPEGQLIAQLAEAMAGPMGGFIKDMLLDAVGWFEVEYKDGIVMRGATILASEEAAKSAKEKMDAAMSTPMMAKIYEAMPGAKPTLTVEGKEIRFESKLQLPDFSKLGGL